MFQCKDCQDRKPGCHSTCESYIREKKIRNERAEMIREKKKEEEAFDRRIWKSNRIKYERWKRANNK